MAHVRSLAKQVLHFSTFLLPSSEYGPTTEGGSKVQVEFRTMICPTHSTTLHHLCTLVCFTNGRPA